MATNPVLFVNADISIPIREFKFVYSRSPGPGGQNVNKVNTKATLNWDYRSTPHLSEPIKARLATIAKNRINRDGNLVISSHRFRDQNQNVADCLAKLRELILKAVVVPIKRKPTKPTRAAKRRRLESKKHQSQKKDLRRRIGGG
jgi:ribosome-associated protein